MEVYVCKHKEFIMNLQEQVDENTILHFIEEIQSKYNEETGKNKAEKYNLAFSFYDKHYTAAVSREAIDKDLSFEVYIEGDSILFDSFEQHCTGEMWETIKKRCDQYDVWFDELQS